jgi:ABC-2 type transport system permease protein
LLIQIIVYIIPFSHTFLAAPNIFLQNYGIIFIGAAYQFLVFIVLAIVATKIFSSDKILTLKLNFSKKKSVNY